MIPFVDLKAQYNVIGKDIEKRVVAVLESTQYINGPAIAEMEAALAKFAGARHCVACASGTDALLMALMALGIGRNDAVFTTPFTFVATAEVIALLGATPVFVDIDKDTYNIDPQALEKAIANCNKSLTPKAVIPVDLFGLAADYTAINAIAKNHGLTVIEDAAQGFGATHNGKRACGALADISATSFFPAKPLGCAGDGGAVFTNDDAMLEKLLSIRVHGQSDDKYNNVRIGLNARMDTVQAAVILAKLPIFENEIRQRNAVAKSYNQKLGKLNDCKIPVIPANDTCVWAQYSIMSTKKEILMPALKAAGVPTACYYPIPLHLQKAFDYLGYQPGSMPNSEACAQGIFSLPMHPYLAEETITMICDVMKNVLGAK